MGGGVAGGGGGVHDFRKGDSELGEFNILSHWLQTSTAASKGIP